MGVKKIGPDKYEIRFKYLDSEVRRILRGSRADAINTLNQLKSEISKAKAEHQIWGGVTKLKGKPKCFEEVAAEYLLSLPTTKISTVNAYHSFLKNHILPELGQLPIRAVNQSVVERFRADLSRKSSKTRKDRQLEARTINTVMVLLTAILHFAFRTDLIDKVPKVRSLEETKSDVDPLSQDELRKVLDAAHPFWHPILSLLAATGLREGECFGLRWSDVDFDKGEIRITRQYSKGQDQAPKTASSVRTLMMLPMARAALIELKTREVVSIDGQIMLSRTGARLHPNLAYTNWLAALKRAGVRRRRLHQLRHTYASLLLQAGVKPGWISKQLGHSNLKTMFDHYIKFIPDAEELDSKIANIVFVSHDKTSPKNQKIAY